MQAFKLSISSQDSIFIPWTVSRHRLTSIKTSGFNRETIGRALKCSECKVPSRINPDSSPTHLTKHLELSGKLAPVAKLSKSLKLAPVDIRHFGTVRKA